MKKMNVKKMKKMVGIGMFGLLAGVGGGMFFAPKAYAKDIEVSDSDQFWSAYTSAENGDVIKLTGQVNIGYSQKKTMQSDTVLTIDLQGNKLISSAGGDNFGVGDNSVLLFKNGTMDYMDTMNASTGIVILNNVTVSNTAWLGNTDTWIVNNSPVTTLSTESAYVNQGATDLHPVSGYNGAYKYENAAPAMVGSGTKWKCLATLQADFDQAASDPATYSRVILLQDAYLENDATLSTPGITLNLSGYKLNLNGYKLTLNNSTGVCTIANGTVVGDVDMSDTKGEVVLDDLTVTGTVNCDSHPITIEGGVFNNIVAGNGGKVTIEGGTFAGELLGSTEGATYEISGGYFTNKIPENSLKEGYDLIQESGEQDGVHYNYKVVKHTHTKGTYHPAVAATCHSEGNVEYWDCAGETCDEKLDVEGNVIENVVLPIDKDNHEGETEIRNAKAATSVTEGYTGDTYCKSCGELIKKGEVIPVKGDSDPEDEKIDTRTNAIRLDNSIKTKVVGSKLYISWDRIPGADEYEVYAAYCGNEYEKVKTTKKRSTAISELNGEALNQKEIYKFYVVALKNTRTIGRSITFHMVGTANTTYSNAKAVNIDRDRSFIMLRKDQKSTIKAKLVLENSKRKAISEDHVATFRYVSNNNRVAQVSEDGVITAVGRGHATIYVYSANGRRAEVNVEVDNGWRAGEEAK